jgi:outer membrane protein OmpA-like peptidoglycan-associated protein
MEHLVKGIKTLLWVAVGPEQQHGPLQLGVAVEVNPLSATVNPPKLEVRETPTEPRIELPGDVLFDFDKGDIRPDAEPTLRQTAEIIQRYPRATVAIAGYADAKGADTYNLQLSKRRATSVKAWLV